MRTKAVLTVVMLALVAAPAFAQEQVTVVKRDISRFSGRFEAWARNTNLIYVRVSQNDQQRVPLNDVLVMEVGGPAQNLPANEIEAARGGDHVLVPTSGEILRGRLLNIEGGEGSDTPKEPRMVSFKPSNGNERRARMNEVRRFYSGNYPQAAAAAPAPAPAPTGAGRAARMLTDGGPSHILAPFKHALFLVFSEQIQAGNFGQADSFSGGYQIDETTPMGERPSFGPYQVDETNTTIMASVSGFKPEQAEHIRQSELCATCHTLFTPYLDASGQVAGEFPEQTPYLEWLNSAFTGSLGCNDCHMALIPGDVQLSITGSPPRSGARQHNFIGGNAYLGRIFRTFGEELSLAASSEQVEAMIAATEDFLTSPPPAESERPQTGCRGALPAGGAETGAG